MINRQSVRRPRLATTLLAAVVLSGCGSDGPPETGGTSASSQESVTTKTSGYDHPFGNSTASAFYAALYGGAMSPVGDGSRAIDEVVGGQAIDVNTLSLLVHSGSQDQGAFLGGRHRTGAIAKILRWWDYTNPADETVEASVSLVDFDTREHAVEAAQAEAIELSGGKSVEETDGGTEVLATFEDEETKTEIIYSIPTDRPLIVGTSCAQGVTATSACDLVKMRTLIESIVARLPEHDTPDTTNVAGPNNLPPGVEPLLQYEFDVDQNARSYLDLGGTLRATWKDNPPPAGTYGWTGRNFTFTIATPEPGGMPLQLIVDRIPIGDSAVGLEFTKTVCVDPSGNPSPFCGAEVDHDADGNFLGGRTARAYGDEEQTIVANTRGHMVIMGSFLDMSCGLPVLWSEETLADDLVRLCEESMVAVGKAFGES